MHKSLFVPALVVFLLFTQIASGKRTHTIDELQKLLGKSKQDTIRVRLLIETATYYKLKVNLSPRDIDSVAYFSEEALTLSRDLEQPEFEGVALYLCAYKYRNTGKVKEAIDCVQESIKILSSYGTTSDLAEAYLELGDCYSNTTDSELAPKIEAYGRAEILFLQANNKKKYATALAAKAEVYSFQGDPPKAVDSIKKALAIYEQNHFTDIYRLYDLLGMKYGEQSDFTESIKYILMSVAAMEQQLDSSCYDCNIYYHAGLIQSAYGEFRKARAYLNKALSIAIKVESPLRFGIGQGLISSYYSTNENEQAIKVIEYFEKTQPPVLLDDRMALASIAFSCYLKEKNYPLAKKYEHELLQGFASYPVTDYRQAIIYASLISGYIETGRFKEAKKFADYYEIYNKFYKSPMGLNSTYLWLSEAESGLGDYRSALIHFKLATQINDSIYKADKDNQISQLLIQYEDKKKQQDIKLLTKQTLLQNATEANKIDKKFAFSKCGIAGIVTRTGPQPLQVKATQ